MNQTPIVFCLAALVAFLAALAVFFPAQTPVIAPLAAGCLTGLFAYLQVKKD
jgi:hypothetical protein